MAINKITYDTKVAINIDSTIPDINKCNASDLNEIKNVVNNNADEMTNYVKNTDYASSIKSGVIYAEPQNGFMVGPTGKPYTPIMPYNNYSSLPNTYFISKGTLENVISGKGLIDKNVNDLTNYTKTSDLSSVATSGSYNDLTDTPTIPSISDSYGTSTTNGYSQNYINTNTLNPSGEPSTSETDVSSATITNTLEAPMNIDLKGNTLQNGTPTPSSPIPVNNVSGDNQVIVCGENILDISTENSTLQIDSTKPPEYATIQNGSVDFSCTLSWAYLFFYIPMKRGTTYSFKYKTDGDFYGIRFYKKDKSTFITNFDNSTGEHTATYTHDNDEDGVYLRLHVYQSVATLNYAQVSAGETSVPYEAYNGTTYPINLPSGMELNKIGTYQDYIYKENGKWYLHKEIGKATFNGTEEWATSGAAVPSGVSAYSNGTNSGFISNTQGYSNLFTIIDNATDWNVPSGNGTARYTSNQLYIKILTSIASDVNALKTWLGNNNITMYGILSTPTNTEITYTTLIEQLESIKNAMSKEGTTNVNQVNNDLPFILDLSVFNDTYNGRYQSVLEMYKRLSNQ